MKKRPPDTVGRYRPAVVTPHELVRSRLLSRVTAQNELGALHCTLVVGPAGFGKTTLLAQAYRALTGDAQAVIWLECNEHDADPSHFLASLYDAADAAGANTTDPEFNTSDIARRAGDLAQNIYFCIDALEHIIATDSEPLLERLLACLPKSTRVLLGSRRQPNSWFLERELQGLAATIEANELRLTRPELGELLTERFTPEQILLVSALTEGWPVAAQLTRLRARDIPSVGEMLERLAHEGLGLFEYLAHKVLEGLSPEQRELLRATSILSSIRPALANALLQRDDGYALLSGVLRLAPIVSVTSDPELTLRVHPLLRQYMRGELARMGQEQVQILHCRAARALAASGQILEAVQHALEADDLSLAVEVFDQAGGEEMIFTLGPRQVAMVIGTLPPAARPLSLRLQFTDFLLALVEGHARLAADFRTRLLQNLTLSNAPAHGPIALWKQFAADYANATIELLADLNEGVSPGVLERCAAVERLSHLNFARNEAYLGLILALEVLIFCRHTNASEARRALNDYIALCERNHFAPHLPSVNPQRGMLAFLEGDFDAALNFLARPQSKRIDRFAEPEPLLAQLSKCLVTRIEYERNEPEQAFSLIDSTVIDPDRTLPESWALSCCLRALCLEALNRPAEADHILEQEQRQARRRDARRLSLIIDAQRLELSLRRSQPQLGQLDTLEQALQREAARVEASWLFVLVLGRAVIPALVATGEHARSRPLAESLVTRAQACGNQLLIATGRILSAQAAHAAGDITRAHEHLTEALNITGPMRAVRPYMDCWPKVTAPLLQIIAQQISVQTGEHIRQILRLLDATVPGTLPGWSELSERERDVLSALSAHTTTKAVAKQLGLSPETVKHHLKRIFAKLDVHSRTEALQWLARLP
jgi:ATP/maltotriose-dependent transcriptional regulator MalT